MPRLRPAVPGLLLATTLALLPAVARAQGHNMYLQEARQLIHRHRYAKAIHELRRGLDLPGLPVDQEEAILGWLGAAYQLAGRPAEAVAPWRRRVRLTPKAPLPRALPASVRRAYEKVRTATVIIQHLPPPGAFAGRPLSLTASLVDRKHLTSDLLAYYRREGEPDWQVVRFHRQGDDWTARLTPPPVAGEADGYALEYYLVAQAPEGEILHSLGTPTEPLTLKVVASPLAQAPAPNPGPEKIQAVDIDQMPQSREAVAHRHHGGMPTWLWITLGVVAVGAATTTAVVVGSQGGGLPSTTLGAVHYPLRGGPP